MRIPIMSTPADSNSKILSAIRRGASDKCNTVDEFVAHTPPETAARSLSACAIGS